MAAVQDLTQIMAELDPVYAQSRNIYNQQIGGLQAEEDAGIAQLETQRVRGFRDIARSANTRGLDFWGIPIEEQATYNDKHQGAVGSIKAATKNQRTTLQQAIASLEQDRYKTALSRQDTQRAAAEEERRTLEERAWKERQAGLDRAASAASRGGDDDVDLTVSRDPKTGGYTVLENGRASTNYDLNAYARLTGKNIVDLLRNGDAKDKQAVKWYEDKIKKYGNRDQAKYLEELKRDRRTAFYLGG